MSNVKAIQKIRRRRKFKTAIGVLVLGANTAVIVGVAGPVVAVATMTTLVTHEFGHYYTARSRGSDPDPPLILSIGILSVGITRVRRMRTLPTRDRVAIINAGPRTALFMLAMITPFAALLFGTIVARIYLTTALGEVFALTAGGDGRSRRRALKSEPSHRKGTYRDRRERILG